MTLLTQANLRAMIVATAVAGTLDILSAFVFARPGVGPIRVLQSVASGPFGDKMTGMGLPGALLGLLTHFAIMAVMVAVFVLVVTARPNLIRIPVLTGAIYGLLLYSVMYWVVLPLRWPSVFPQTGLWEMGNALFSHIVCVGIPMALIVASCGRATPVSSPLPLEQAETLDPA